MGIFAGVSIEYAIFAFQTTEFLIVNANMKNCFWLVIYFFFLTTTLASTSTNNAFEWSLKQWSTPRNLPACPVCSSGAWSGWGSDGVT